MSPLLLYLDTETTDRYTSTAGITQLSAIIVKDGVEVSRINLDINAFSYNRDITVSKKALEVTGKTRNGIKSYPSAPISFFKFTAWLNAHRAVGEYYTLVAYRTQFDLEILLGFFKDQTGSDRKLYEYINYKTLDVLQLVLFCELYGILGKVKNHKLETMCNYYNISIDAHDSLEDVVATRKVHQKLMGALGLPSSKICQV
jgi:DNA polymerase III epsilon subunit-like protein